MIKILSVVLLLSFACLNAQDRVLFSVNPGWSIYNSENGMQVTAHKDFRWLPGLSVAYERENVLGQTLHLEYNLTYRKIGPVFQMVRTSESGPEPIGYIDLYLELAMHNLDIDLHRRLDENFSIDVGPTLSCVSRTFFLDDYMMSDLSPQPNYRDLNDRLVSYALGLNGSLNVEVPFSTEQQHLFFYSGLKVRYIHAVWFDARGRNVADYYQRFLYGQLHVGLGYSL